jgi:two-component system, OmpR family, sensor histidine kinase MtrB
MVLDTSSQLSEPADAEAEAGTADSVELGESSSHRQTLTGALRVLATPFTQVVHLWRRSIQARVVIGTLALSAALAILSGWVLMSRVTDGLLDSKKQSALSLAAAGIDAAQAKLTAAPEVGNVLDLGTVVPQLTHALSPSASAQDDYGIVIIGPSDPLVPGVDEGVLTSGESSPNRRSIPTNLLEKVRSTPGSWWAYSTVYYDDPSTPSQPGLVVGAQVRVPVTGQIYSLFYVFPLQEQQQTLYVVRSALITTGAILVVLLGTIAWLVTRQVVTPVRLARRISERLAAGRLEERMHVRGEDDIARLGVSFNQMASSLQRQIRQLQELSRVQRRFVADVSHELRTPLTTVRMAADLLHDQRATFDPSTARSAELLQRELDRFEGLLTDLLEISRFDAGVAVLTLADVDLRTVVRRVCDSTAALAARRGSRIRLELPPTACLVEADVRRVERIVRNLVINAIQYGEGRSVHVRVASSDKVVAMSVRDHGVGLKAGEDVMVFSRFWRSDPARARTRGGTGLGLSIAVEDTTLHGGRLEAWGKPGVGALFRLTLPRRAGDALDASPLPLVPEGAPATRSSMPPYVHAADRPRGQTP